MSKILSTNRRVEPQQPPTTGRVFKFAAKQTPVVDEKMWAQIKKAARTPNKARQYPSITEDPNT